MTEHLKNPTLSDGRYLYSVYKGVPLPPGLRSSVQDVERNCVVNLVAGEQSLNRVQGLYLQLFQFDVKLFGLFRADIYVAPNYRLVSIFPEF